MRLGRKKILVLVTVIILIIPLVNLFAQEKIDFQIRTDDFYALTNFEFGNADPVWSYSLYIGASYSNSFSNVKYHSSINERAYSNGAWDSEDVNVVWSGTCLDNADNIYIRLEGWEHDVDPVSTYQSDDDDVYSADYDYMNNLSSSIIRNTWQNFKNNGSTSIDYVDCGVEGENGYYKVEFDLYWSWSTPVNPVFTLSDVKPTSFTITLTDKKDYRITHWDYQVSTNTSFTNIVKSNMEMLVPTEEVGGLDVSTTYYVRFRARNEDGTSDYTVYQEVTTAESATPIELTSFYAEPDAEGITLIWETESETENQGFILEKRLVDELSWEHLADYLHYDALVGYGSTTEKHNYQFVDINVKPGARYTYRLGDVGFSGTIIWHDPIEITIESENVKLPMQFGLQKAYPNPFNPSVTLDYYLTKDAQTTLRIYDIGGLLVDVLENTYKHKGAYSIKWQPDNLGSGVYIVRLQSGDLINSQKVIYVK